MNSKNEFYMKTADMKFLDLCDEIDYWKERAEIAEKNAQDWKDKYSKLLDDNLISAQKGVANALMFALSIREGENGSLVIDKETRTILAEQYESNE